MEPLAIQIVDPQSSGISKEVLLAGAGILGTLLASLFGIGGMLLSNKARAKQEIKALEVRAQHEDRDRSVRLKLEKIGRAFELLNELEQSALKFYKTENIKEVENKAAHVQGIFHEQSIAITELRMIYGLYIIEQSDIMVKITQSWMDISIFISSFAGGVLLEKPDTYLNPFMDSITQAQTALSDVIRDEKLIYSPSEPQDKP